MCGWNIHSSLPERQNFSTLLVSFRREMNLLSPRTISFFPPKYQENVKSLSISHSLYFLYFHGVKTEANGANSEVTGAAFFSRRPKTKVALQLGEKGCHTILIEFSLSCFQLHCSLSQDIAFKCCKDWQSIAFFLWQLWHQNNSLGHLHDEYFCFQCFYLKNRQVGSCCVFPAPWKQKPCVCHMHMCP